MLRAYLVFLFELLLSTNFKPIWLDHHHPQHDHFHRRRFTRKYQQKQRIVRSLWFSVLLVMLAFPILWFVIAAAMFTTFVSFTILDETE